MNYLTHSRFVVSRFEVLSMPALERRMRSGRRVSFHLVSPVAGFPPSEEIRLLGYRLSLDIGQSVRLTESDVC